MLLCFANNIVPMHVKSTRKIVEYEVGSEAIPLTPRLGFYPTAVELPSINYHHIVVPGTHLGVKQSPDLCCPILLLSAVFR